MDMMKLKQRFCKDNKVPLQLFVSPYFEERLKLFGFSDKWEEFLTVLEDFESVDAYLEYYNQVKDNIIDYIKNSEAYQKLNSDDMNNYSKFQIRQSDVYKESNIGKKFISIDMKKANFSALVKYAKDTRTKFFDSFNYDEFMKQFTKYDYISNSKYIRQVVFGNCNPKRQIIYESYLMSNFLYKLIDTNLVSESDIYSMCSDEIVISVSDELNVSEIKRFCDDFNEFPISFEYFTLFKLVNTQAYIKQPLTVDKNSIVVSMPILKCVNPYDAPFIYRFMNNEPYQPNDCVFMFENKLAKLMETPNITIKTR